ncbi:MAG: Do family serine endopeptidase [Bacteroidetes bacterium]|nr:Do family serine endopeptidase [Bacteroidota bacterium]MCL2301711.1 Do family serine endopeptidase [Lentimicrobiaceae bacterium]
MKKTKLTSAILVFTGILFGVLLTTSTTIQCSPSHNALTAETVVQTNPMDFTYAAEKSVNSVVHVTTMYKVTPSQGRGDIDTFFEFFFGRPQNPRQYEEPREQPGGSGSGVILSEDGYIVTNNHVIDQASSIEITLNDKRTFKAEVVGADPTTDIALLKIEANGLTPMHFGNSDNLKVGEWVLAVGNPFNLTSTVTAGIVSAKARNINILNADLKIESFIQTDAAVNPGNSGGALVNTRGELVGINTAIASRTGSFSGYSFAVPASIVSKVVADLKEFGVVQRAILGVQMRDINAEFAKEKKLPTLEGVYVANVIERSAAQIAGIKAEDIVTAIGGVKVKSMAELQEQIGRYRPGDIVEITVLRNGKEQKFQVELRNLSGNTGIVKAVDLAQLGAKFQPINNNTKRKFGISGGLEVISVDKTGRLAKAGVQKGYIILKANRLTIHSEEDLAEVYEQIKADNDEDKVLLLAGVYPNGQVVYYAVDLNE